MLQGAVKVELIKEHGAASYFHFFNLHTYLVNLKTATDQANLISINARSIVATRYIFKTLIAGDDAGDGIIRADPDAAAHIVAVAAEIGDKFAFLIEMTDIHPLGIIDKTGM
jgi:hypothetical protein